MRKRIHASLLLVLLSFFFLEALLWARQATTVAQYAVYPHFGLDAEGNVHYWTRTYARYPESHHVVRYYDENRRLLDTVNVPINEQEKLRAVLSSDLWMAQRPTVWDQIDNPSVIRRERRFRTWAFHLLRTLNEIEAHRRGVRSAREVRSAPISWIEQDNRVIAIDNESREVVGDPGIEFVGDPDFTALGWFRRDARLQRYRGILDVGDGSLSFVSVSAIPGEVVGASREPVRISVEPLGIKGRVVNTSRDGALIAQGRMLVLLRGDGTIATGSEWGEDEDIIFSRSRGSSNGLETTLGAVSPVGTRIRLRIVKPGDETIVRDIDMFPTGAVERTIAFASGLVAIARPLPLNIVSALSDPPRTFPDLYAWWWRDPYFAAGSIAWLVVSMLVAAFCGWRARRSALVRCPGCTTFWTAVGVLLGPLGLLWMRLIVGKLPVVDGRAVNIESDAWPEPALTGTEVFA